MAPLSKPLLVFLIILSITGCAVVWLATSSFGAGLSSDAIRIISTGQNFIEGRGLITSTGAPLIFCPPYYSIMLGLLGVIFHSDVFTVGMYLNIIVFGAIVFCAGVLFILIKPGKPIYTVVGSLIVFSSPSLIKISANVAPDPLFILFVVLFLTAATLYTRQPTRSNFIGLLVSALLAASQRYLGLTVVMTGVVLVIWKNRKSLLRALSNSLIFGLLSSGPTLAYIIIHNYFGYGTLTGPRYEPWALGNLRITIEKLEHWFIPGSIIFKTGIWIWAGIALALMLAGILFAWKHGQRKIMQEAKQGMPILIFTAIYFLTLIFMVSYQEHHPIMVDRIHVVLLIPLLALFIEYLPLIFTPVKSVRTRFLVPIAIAVFSVWLIYPIVSNYRYLRNSVQNGESSVYNIHNTRTIRESKLALYLENNSFPEYSSLYSNYNETAWFLTRHNVVGIPTINKAVEWTIQPGNAFLIWFNLPELNYMPKKMLTLEQVSEFIKLEPVYSGVDGSIYRICQNNPYPPRSESR